MRLDREVYGKERSLSLSTRKGPSEKVILYVICAVCDLSIDSQNSLLLQCIVGTA